MHWSSAEYLGQSPIKHLIESILIRHCSSSLLIDWFYTRILNVKKLNSLCSSDLAANLHLEDVSDITPTAIAIEVPLYHPILSSAHPKNPDYLLLNLFLNLGRYSNKLRNFYGVRMAGPSECILKLIEYHHGFCFPKFSRVWQAAVLFVRLMQIIIIAIITKHKLFFSLYKISVALCTSLRWEQHLQAVQSVGLSYLMYIWMK